MKEVLLYSYSFLSTSSSKLPIERPCIIVPCETEISYCNLQMAVKIAPFFIEKFVRGLSIVYTRKELYCVALLFLYHVIL